jgi:hypothetical protein
LRRARELGPSGAWPPPAPMAHEVVTIEHGVDRADGRQVRAGEFLPQFFADLGRAPPWILPL